MEEQSTVTNGPEAFTLCIARATTSLPVPVSPSSSAGQRHLPSFSIKRITWRVRGDCPTRMWRLSLGCADMFVPGRSNVGLIYGVFPKDKLYG